MKIAINQWCFPDGTALDRVFGASSRAGFQGVELNLYGPGQVGLTMDSSADDARAIKRLADSHGIELKSLSTGLLWDAPLSSPDPAVRENGRSIVRKQLELASVMEVDAVLVVPGAVTKEVSYEECYQRSQHEVAELAKQAKQWGVKIGIENVWNRFLLSPLDMLRYIDELDSDWVGVYFDVGNVLQFGFPEQWIRYLGKRIVKVHVKDFSTKIGNIHGFVPLLAGDVDWPAVRDALMGVGYDDYLTAELSPYGAYPDQLAIDTARQMTAIVKG
ncbi:MAG: sugar phosphate isomerase/epimerase family protein [Bacilli bacterium]